MSVINYLKPKNIDDEVNRLMSMTDDYRKYAVIITWENTLSHEYKWELSNGCKSPMNIHDANKLRHELQTSGAYSRDVHIVRGNRAYIYRFEFNVILWKDYVKMLIDKSNEKH